VNRPRTNRKHGGGWGWRHPPPYGEARGRIRPCISQTSPKFPQNPLPSSPRFATCLPLAGVCVSCVVYANAGQWTVVCRGWRILWPPHVDPCEALLGVYLLSGQRTPCFSCSKGVPGGFISRPYPRITNTQSWDSGT